jgi:hypothetical protein
VQQGASRCVKVHQAAKQRPHLLPARSRTRHLEHGQYYLDSTTNQVLRLSPLDIFC